MSFQDYCNQLTAIDKQKVTVNNTFVISFSNEKGKIFTLDPTVAVNFIKFLEQSHAECYAAWEGIESRKDSYTKFEQNSYRAIFRAASGVDDLVAISSLGGSQTRQLTGVLSKLICYLGGLTYLGVDNATYFDPASVRKALSNVPDDLSELAGTTQTAHQTDLGEKFKTWMRHNNLSEKTIDSYSVVSINLANQLLQGVNGSFLGIFSISNSEVLDELIQKLDGIKEWGEKNVSGNGMYRAGINKYREFLQYLNTTIGVTSPPNLRPPLTQNASLQGFVSQAKLNFAQASLRISDGMLNRFGASLLAKRFLILTGLSGSGKTKLAHAFASWLTESKDQYRLVAVGADWTTNENVIGYQDALQPEIYRKPSNGLLDLVLRAAADTDRPYFLILDEMNLSHVERYFADILSAIESRQVIALHASEESLKSGENDILLVPSKISLPKNLFIVGTVNVDETTYMFSPKVLDRANVIEFRATADDIAAFLDAPSAVNMDMLAGKGAAFGAAFVTAAADEVQLTGETATKLKARLAEIFAALAPIGAEFGYRTAYEITRFTYYHDNLTGAGWQFNDALDAQVLQKLMPKLHGSQRRLEPVLKALEAFCTEHQCNSSLEKIKRMQDRLKDGFTSFAEA